MQKFAVLCSALLLAACSAAPNAESDTQPAVDAVPCSYSCVKNYGVPCGKILNTQQVQKPRVTEIMPKSRPCCNDVNPNAKTVIPDSPEIYVIAANRTLRSMLSRKDSLFNNKTKIFVAETINNEADMPTGIEKGTASLKRNLSADDDFEVVSDRGGAKYVLSSEVSWYDTTTKNIPAIKYSLQLYDTKGQKIGEWNEILHQANGDRSWW